MRYILENPYRKTLELRRPARVRGLVRSNAGDRQLEISNSTIHKFTYVALFCFTFVLYFRPQEWFSKSSVSDSFALVLALLTFLLYFPTQFLSRGNLFESTREIKCILFITAFAFITIPIARDPNLAWKIFNDPFIKVVLIFVIVSTVLTTKSRLTALILIAMGMGVVLSYKAVDMYSKGILNEEGYRVNVDFGGMFGNPNDTALHLVIYTPIAFALFLASRNWLLRIIFFATFIILILGNMMTLSRGGFLGLLAVGGVLLWKLGRKQRLKSIIVATVLGGSLLLFTPGNFGVRMLSIFVPSLDPVGSSDQRREALDRSILVTLRNPLGIGIGNTPIVGVRNLQTHNAYTQVSSELGWLAFAAYLMFLIYPMKRLRAVEKDTYDEADQRWIYLMSVGLQAGLAGYMVSSFFGSVAYQWYVYYPVAFAICLDRLHKQSTLQKKEHAPIQLSPVQEAV